MKQAYDSISTKGGTSISDDLEYLKAFLLDFEEEQKIGDLSLRRLLAKVREQDSNRRLLVETLMVAKYLKLYLNISWYRFWGGPK